MAKPYTCRHCGRAFERRAKLGRKPAFCSQTCRQRDFEARRGVPMGRRLRRPATGR